VTNFIDIGLIEQDTKELATQAKTKSYKPAKFASVWCCFRNVLFTIFFNCRNDLCVWIELFKFNYTIRVENSLAVSHLTAYTFCKYVACCQCDHSGGQLVGVYL
jgi:hypothetical protein